MLFVCNDIEQLSKLKRAKLVTADTFLIGVIYFTFIALSSGQEGRRYQSRDSSGGMPFVILIYAIFRRHIHQIVTCIFMNTLQLRMPCPLTCLCINLLFYVHIHVPSWISDGVCRGIRFNSRSRLIFFCKKCT